MEYEFPTEDTVPPEKLQQLRHSKELKSCLKNPHVRQIMKSILNSENPSKAIALAMREPIFVEMADACLKIVEPQDNELNQMSNDLWASDLYQIRLWSVLGSCIFV